MLATTVNTSGVETHEEPYHLGKRCLPLFTTHSLRETAGKLLREFSPRVLLTFAATS